jgi:predicted nucleic acid-binding protein
MPAKPVVLNNTPLVALWAIWRLDLLRQLFGEVLIPEAVREEFLARDAGERSRSLEAAPWIRTVALTHPKRVLALTGLDRGEAEVLVLAEEQDARLVVIDEKKVAVMRSDLHLGADLVRRTLEIAGEG